MIAHKAALHEQVILIGNRQILYHLQPPDLTDQKVLTRRESSGVEKRKGANIDISEQLESPHQFERSNFDQSIGNFGIFGMF